MKKVILITGSNGGIGLAITDYLLKKGHRNLACHYRTGSDKIKALLTSFDLDHAKHLFQADLTNESEIKLMNSEIATKLGFVSTLVNVAGMSTNVMSWKMTKEQFLDVINNNLVSTFLCSKEFIPSMRNESWGRIINFSSVVGSTGVVGASHYCAAKAGIEGFSKALSLELINKNITVNTIALGYFQYGLIDDVPAGMQESLKERIPAKRFGNGHDIGSMVHFLSEEDSSYLTGQVLHLNGGLL